MSTKPKTERERVLLLDKMEEMIDTYAQKAIAIHKSSDPAKAFLVKESDYIKERILAAYRQELI
jgi:hypothetical protein